MCSREGHQLISCKSFLDLPIKDRKRTASTKGLCFACLKGGHMYKDCKRKMTCEICSRKHPSCLHDEELNKPPSSSNDTGETVHAFNKHVNLYGSDDSSSMTTMIVPVFISHVSDPDVEILTYAMLDTQSDSTFILNKTSNQLGVNGPTVKLSLSTLSNENETVRSQRITGLRIRGATNDKFIDLPATYTRPIMPTDLSHIPTPDTVRKWPHLSMIADKLMALSDIDVGILIGYNCPQALTPREVIAHQENHGPYAQLTDLGWTVVGCSKPVSFESDRFGISHRVIASETGNTETLDSENKTHLVLRTKVKEILQPVELAKILERDFIEHQHDEAPLSVQDRKFLKTMNDSIHIASNGHLESSLPFIDEEPNLLNNRHMAQQRLRSLERKLRRDVDYAKQYTTFMEDLIDNGYAEPVPIENTSNRHSWYIPHHSVYHPKKPNKIRVIFDGSAKYKGESLNEHLLQGPDLINNLVGILCRFRKHPVAIMCDIQSMFHQFFVNEEHRDYLRFLWWEKGDTNKAPKDYRMAVHLFGATSSPGCCNYAMKHIASLCEEEEPRVAGFIRENFYVDDGLTSCNTTSEAIDLVKGAQKQLNNYHVRLHKFISNSREVMESIPESERSSQVIELDLLRDALPVERALGINWCVDSDCFKFSSTLEEKSVTRRGILSMVSLIYDPVGFISPVILGGKIILQDLCRSKAAWDDPLPESLESQWTDWKKSLALISQFEIKRSLNIDTNNQAKMELHHFSDASQTGYGQCSYLRTIDTNNEVNCTLLMSKARVAPIRPVTIPRLELTAALMSVRISKVLKRELNLTNCEEYFWTDSRIVLEYIANETKRYHTFVANRVQEIRETTRPNQWCHVPTAENPADIVSRGATVEELLNTPEWFDGPNFLHENCTFSSASPTEYDVPQDDPEVKRNVMVTKAKESTDILDCLRKFSSWMKMKKVVAACLRIKPNQSHAPKFTPTDQSCMSNFSVSELQAAETVIIRLTQESAFASEIACLKSNKPLKSSSNIDVLDPFLDDKKVLRVGGRVRNSTLPYEVKHPALLPQKDPVTNALLLYVHEQMAHQGRGITTNELRNRGYWVIGASKRIANLIYHCVKCRKLRRKAETQKMADLPYERVTPAPPFTHSGMDCFGPFYIKEGRKELKRWGLLFTCMASRAIHLEVLTTMSTDGFLNALRRFISLRGNVRLLCCDHGSNFIGANSEMEEALKVMQDPLILKYMTEHQCEYRFNPPNASHMGGMWERQIRSVRNVLSSILTDHSSQLDDDSLRTVMAEASVIVNSRPLSVDMLNDPTGLTPITANQLLHMKTSVVLPPPGLFQRPDLYSRKRWRRVQYIAEQFWIRWKREYMTQLQQRQRWTKTQRNVKVGDVVLVEDDTLARNHWKLARVQEVSNGSDGRPRKAKIIIGDPYLDKNGKRLRPASYLERPVHKLVMLVEA